MIRKNALSLLLCILFLSACSGRQAGEPSGAVPDTGTSREETASSAPEEPFLEGPAADGLLKITQEWIDAWPYEDEYQALAVRTVLPSDRLPYGYSGEDLLVVSGSRNGTLYKWYYEPDGDGWKLVTVPEEDEKAVLNLIAEETAKSSDLFWDTFVRWPNEYDGLTESEYCLVAESRYHARSWGENPGEGVLCRWYLQKADDGTWEILGAGK